MTFPFSDIMREINGVLYRRPEDVSIKVDSLDSFVDAISKEVDLVEDNSRAIKGAEFCGVKVVQHDLVPPGMAVVTHGDEIVNIIRYA
jgi:hypothetical protein